MGWPTVETCHETIVKLVIMQLPVRVCAAFGLSVPFQLAPETCHPGEWGPGQSPVSGSIPQKLCGFRQGHQATIWLSYDYQIWLSYDYLSNLQNCVFQEVCIVEGLQTTKIPSFSTLFGSVAPVFVFTPKVAGLYAYSLATAHYVLSTWWCSLHLVSGLSPKW